MEDCPGLREMNKYKTVTAELQYGLCSAGLSDRFVRPPQYVGKTLQTTITNYVQSSYFVEMCFPTFLTALPFTSFQIKICFQRFLVNLNLLIKFIIRNQIYSRRCPPLCRPHSGGDLCGRDRPGDNGQIPLPEKRDVPKPGSEGSQSGRQPGFRFQQPGRPSEHLQWKPKGVFHLTGCPMSWWTGGCRQGGASCQASGL